MNSESLAQNDPSSASAAGGQRALGRPSTAFITKSRNPLDRAASPACCNGFASVEGRNTSANSPQSCDS